MFEQFAEIWAECEENLRKEVWQNGDKMLTIPIMWPDGITERVVIQKPTSSGEITAKGYYGSNILEIEFINTPDIPGPVALPDGDTTPPKPFGEACAEVWRDVKGYVGGKDALDPSVKEQVSGEVDTMIERHESRDKRSFPPKALG